MYFCRMEPVYSQGVGGFVLLTNDIKNVKKMYKQIYNYARYILKYDEEDAELWEFYVYIYESINDETYKLVCKYNGLSPKDLPKKIEFNVDKLIEEDLDEICYIDKINTIYNEMNGKYINVDEFELKIRK